jgi:putative ABC transport system permease protein
MSFEGTPYLLTSALQNEFPQIETAVKHCVLPGVSIQHNEELLRTRTMATNSAIFALYTLPLKWGAVDSKTLENRQSAVISSSLSQKLFNDKNPVGETIVAQINGSDETLTVQAVYHDLPKNSSFRAECLLNDQWGLDYLNYNLSATDAAENWEFNFWTTWILLNNTSDLSTISNALPAFFDKHVSNQSYNEFRLQKMAEAYLNSEGIYNVSSTGNKKHIKLFSTIALLIIIVAVFNYLILSTVVSSLRRKEMAIRKANGASSHELRNQLLGESVLLAFFSLPIALFLAWQGIPIAERLFETHLYIVPKNIPVYALAYGLLTLLAGSLSGLYTAGHLSRLNVINLFNNKLTFAKDKTAFRSILIIVQLVVFCAFISTALIIHAQYSFSLKKDTGHRRDHLLIVDIPIVWDNYEPFINTIRSNSNVISAAGTSGSLPTIHSTFISVPHYTDNTVKVEMEGLEVDFDFVETMDLTITQGRSFDRTFGNDLENSVLLNETAVNQLGIIDPIGQPFQGKTIVGIVKDFNLHSIHSPIPPLAISMSTLYLAQIAIHYQPGTKEELAAQIEKEWTKLMPDSSFSYLTYEDNHQSIYTSEKNLQRIITYAALFTCIIAAFGLFGLTLFETKSKTKSTGIRKVMGSSTLEIMSDSIKKITGFVILSTLLSIPPILFFTNKWLDGFAYKIDFPWWVFLLSGLLAMVISLLTVIWQTWRAATRNPVESLRYE